MPPIAAHNAGWSVIVGVFPASDLAMSGWQLDIRFQGGG